MGCWSIGGPQSRAGKPVGWDGVNDEESLRALRRAFELGVNFFDTADIYGSGHSERLIAQAFGHCRDQIVIASKAGYDFDEATGEALGECGEPDYIRRCCEASLRRLKTDRLDIYFFHLARYDLEKAPEVLAVFEELVRKGKTRFIGWSVDEPAKAALFAESPHCTAIEQMLNIFDGNRETLALCEKNNLASVNRSPLAKGLLSGKFTPDTKFEATDVRNGWNLREGTQAEQLKKTQAIRDILTSEGRTPAQGALAWLWALSPATIPIPGFKSVAQVEENVGAMRFGPLSPEQMHEIETLTHMQCE